MQPVGAGPAGWLAGWLGAPNTAPNLLTVVIPQLAQPQLLLLLLATGPAAQFLLSPSCATFLLWISALPLPLYTPICIALPFWAALCCAVQC